MVYFLTALYYEAKDIIEHYKMKRVMKITKFQVFKGKNELLIISGTSGLKAAVATTYLLDHFEYDENDILVNIGICGAAKKGVFKGEIFLCNKLIDNISKKAFYPDMLFKHPFSEGTLESFSEVESCDIDDNIEADIVDQEGAFVYETASMFLKPQNIHIIKIVSDILNPDFATPQSIDQLVKDKMPRVYEWLDERIKVQIQAGDNIISLEESYTLKTLSENMKLTSAMNVELKKLSKQYKIRNGYIFNVINEYRNSKCKSKSEGKKIFGELKEKLMEL